MSKGIKREEYYGSGIQPLDIWLKCQHISPLLATALKYIVRAGHKDDIDKDLDKAKNYIVMFYEYDKTPLDEKLMYMSVSADVHDDIVDCVMGTYDTKEVMRLKLKICLRILPQKTLNYNSEKHKWYEGFESTDELHEWYKTLCEYIEDLRVVLNNSTPIEVLYSQKIIKTQTPAAGVIVEGDVNPLPPNR